MAKEYVKPTIDVLDIDDKDLIVTSNEENAGRLRMAPSNTIYGKEDAAVDAD